MNIAFFLLPKSKVAYIYDDCTLRQGLEKLRHHGYTAVPVISREGRYVGSVSEGDFLWHLVPDSKELKKHDAVSMEDIPISLILDRNKNLPVGINSSVEDLVECTVSQNFVPVVDDQGNFIGIVTRSDVLKYYYSDTEDMICDLSLMQRAI